MNIIWNVNQRTASSLHLLVSDKVINCKVITAFWAVLSQKYRQQCSCQCEGQCEMQINVWYRVNTHTYTKNTGAWTHKETKYYGVLYLILTLEGRLTGRQHVLLAVTEKQYKVQWTQIASSQLSEEMHWERGSLLCQHDWGRAKALVV